MKGQNYDKPPIISPVGELHTYRPDPNPLPDSVNEQPCDFDMVIGKIEVMQAPWISDRNEFFGAYYDGRNNIAEMLEFIEKTKIKIPEKTFINGTFNMGVLISTKPTMLVVKYQFECDCNSCCAGNDKDFESFDFIDAKRICSLTNSKDPVSTVKGVSHNLRHIRIGGIGMEGQGLASQQMVEWIDDLTIDGSAIYKIMHDDFRKRAINLCKKHCDGSEIDSRLIVDEMPLVSH